MNKRASLRTKDSVPSIFRVLDIAVLSLSLLVVASLYSVPLTTDYLLVLTVMTTVYLFFSDSTGLYRRLRHGHFSERVTLIGVVTSISFLLVISLIFLFKESETFSRLTFFLWYLLSLVGLVGWRVIYRFNRRRSYRSGQNLRKVAIVGLTESGIKLRNEIEKFPELGFKFVGFFDDRDVERLQIQNETLSGGVMDALELAKSDAIDSVYICLPVAAEGRIAHIIRTLSDSTVNVFFVPDFLLSTIMHGNISSLGNVDTVSVFEQPVSGSQQFYKRAFDIAFSFWALLLLAPVLLAIAVAIKTTSKGPVLFRQHRYGLDGKKINVHKFRSMTVMENSDKVVQAKKGDARITKVGAFLRRTSLDELPQFFDVLIGNMSVVGPRPHAVAHNEEYRKLVDYYMLRHKVKPGITGWAQINGWRGETDTIDKMEKRIEFDLEYIRAWSLWLDIKIIFLTIFKGFINKNAY
ncbi:UDP-glucose:undecaprenyl-phosphate glucose-1-phosphate transferase [uncultured Thiomicrorhabdus sp.]